MVKAEGGEVTAMEANGRSAQQEKPATKKRSRHEAENIALRDEGISQGCYNHH